jgi:hypothetical protein
MPCRHATVKNKVATCLERSNPGGRPRATGAHPGQPQRPAPDSAAMRRLQDSPATAQVAFGPVPDGGYQRAAMRPKRLAPHLRQTRGVIFAALAELRPTMPIRRKFLRHATYGIITMEDLKACCL